MKREAIARVAHEINRAYCASLGDTSQAAWEEAPEWQRKSALLGVDMHLANPDATPEQSHESWLAEKLAQGWTHGAVKDAEKKEHPCILPYAELPAEQKAKDYLFRAVVHALKDIPDADEAVAVALQAHTKALRQKAGRDAGASEPAATVAVRYVGRRERWKDTLYGSGLYFNTGQVRVLPIGIAQKLLRHKDVFVEHDGERTEQAIEVAPTREPSDDTDALLEQARKEGERTEQALQQIQQVFDQIDRMDKAALEEFARNNYRQEIDKRRNLDALREQVRQMIDQFGVV